LAVLYAVTQKNPVKRIIVSAIERQLLAIHPKMENEYGKKIPAEALVCFAGKKVVP
jgi:hypothetical protein